MASVGTGTPLIPFVLGAGNPVDAWPHATTGTAAKIQTRNQRFIFRLLDFPLLAPRSLVARTHHCARRRSRRYARPAAFPLRLFALLFSGFLGI